jgi:CRISPR/Cas system CSM-associated protein Csm3 (group 7 of RAMP superfamily)
MTTTEARWQHSREIATRWVITGTLTLTSPMRIGASLASPLSDMPILLDGASGEALLPGASLAGALRAYLVAHGQKPNALFGWQDARERKPEDGQHGQQSWLMIRDSYAKQPKLELRDGVAIDARTRTAEPMKKYDLQVLQAGTTFDLHIELPLMDSDTALCCRQLLAFALHALGTGQIHLGGRSRRGFGACVVAEWRVVCYDMCRAAGLLAWLRKDEREVRCGTKIAELLDVPLLLPKPAQSSFQVEATFALASPLLIRSGLGAANEPDVMHLRNGQGQPIVSGTSLAGVVRGRVLRILNTLGKTNAAALVGELFGEHDETKKQSRASRLWVKESVVEKTDDWVQTRVKIDRFTGGTLPTALFSEQPIFPRSEAKVTFTLTIRAAQAWEKGVLLLVLKDLWTGDLAIGGSSSIGRGRFRGLKASIVDGEQTIALSANGLPADAAQRETLQGYVTALVNL